MGLFNNSTETILHGLQEPTWHVGIPAEVPATAPSGRKYQFGPGLTSTKKMTKDWYKDKEFPPDVIAAMEATLVDRQLRVVEHTALEYFIIYPGSTASGKYLPAEIFIVEKLEGFFPLAAAQP